MEIYVLNHDLDRIGAVDIYESFVWNPSYSSVGGWELKCPLNYFDLLQTDRIIQCTEDDEHNGLIEFTEKVTDEEGIESLHVKGRMLEAILERRVAFGINVYESQEPTAIVADLIDKNIINPVDPSRMISNFQVEGQPAADEGVISYSATGPSLLGAAQSLLQEAQLGFGLIADDEQKKYIFKMYKGENRTEEDNTATDITIEPVENMLANGEFSEGLTGWSTKHNHRAFNFRKQEEFGPYPLVVSGGIVSKSKVCSIGDDGDLYDIWETSPFAYQTMALDASHIYYMAASISNPTDSVIGFGLQWEGSCILNSAKTEGFVKMVSLFVPEIPGNHNFYMGLGDLADRHGQYVYMDYCVLIDLTEAFGAGEEPDLDYCTNNIYFDNGWKYKKQTISFLPNGNDPLIFSRDRDTLIEIEYSKNIVNERNVVYIQGDGLDTMVVTGDPSGWSRKEFFLNLSSIKREVNGIIIPEPSYLEMLKREGRATLRKMVVSELLDGKYYLLSNKRYRRDFRLGDLVNCVDRIGIEVTLRITETTEIWDSSGYSLAVTFGEEVPDIYETIKLVTKGAK